MKQFNFARAVGTAVVCAVTLLGMITRAEAHAGNSSADVIHACVDIKKGDTRIVGVNGTCTSKESAMHWAIVGPAGPAGQTGAPGSFPAGVALGDMQYWDGTAWMMIPAGSRDTILKNCDGIPTWASSGPNSGCGPFHIGDTGPAGGKVFYLTDTSGMHGLEAAPEDQGSAVWGCNGTLISGADGTAVGTGAQNTADILAGCNEAGIAARLADNYVLNGYTGWFLPSKDELNLLYEQRDVVGGFAVGIVSYTSSTENGTSGRWNQYFSSGIQDESASKGFPLIVRAIRSF